MEKTEAATDNVIDVSTWKNAWMGKSSTGYDVYYAESNEGESDSMLVVRNADKNEAESFIGKATSKEQNVITIDAPNATFTFGIEGATEGEESVTSATIKLRDASTPYIRAVVKDHQGRRAWTNPIFLDSDDFKTV